MRFRSSYGLVLAVLLAASVPAAAQSQNSGFVFTDVTAPSGLEGPLAGMMGHGAAWGDYNHDGRPDLFVGGFCDRPAAEYRPARGPVKSVLLRNTPRGFEVDQQRAVSFYGRTSGAVFVDLDNDGALDLYVSNNARPGRPSTDPIRREAQNRHNNLFRNERGQFLDVSAASQACPDTLRTARNIGVLDFDADGLLDLLVLEDRFTEPDPRSLLLRNRGSLLFQVANARAGFPDNVFGLGLAVADINDDGRPDVFLGHSNRFLLSTGDGRFREDEQLNATFAWEPLHGEDWPCGAAFGDLNRDGRLDMVLSVHCETARNKVYLHDGVTNGVPKFRDVTEAVGLAEPVPTKCPHVEIQDFDNDGWPDVYFSAGWLDEAGSFTPLVYRNLGVRAGGIPKLVPPREINPPRAIKVPMIYFPAGPTADFDGDGRLDLFLVNWFQGRRSLLLRNDTPLRNWLDVRVTGRNINAMGIGSLVRVFAPGTPRKLLGLQEIATGYGYASGQVAVCHFGLDQHELVDVEVKLPGGKVIEQPGVKANQRLIVREP
jgi:hypothetical protein